MKIIQMHFELFSRSWWSLNFSLILWMCSWDYDHPIELEILGWMRLEILRSSNGVGDFGMLFEILIIKMELEILEYDLRSWDHQMELEILEYDLRSWDHQMELEILELWFEMVKWSWRLFEILECGWRSWSSNWVMGNCEDPPFWLGDCEMIVIFIKTMLWTYPFIHLSIMIKNNNEIQIPKTLLRTHPIHHNKSWIPNKKKNFWET